MEWWFYPLLLLGAALAIGRIYWSVHKVAAKRNDTWDAKLIEQLRKSGSDPFQPHDVDFFFGMPDATSAQSIATQLIAEGFATDIEHKPDNPSHPYSLHAAKALRLAVPQMQELSRRFTALAKERGGSYDGWAAAHVARTEGNPKLD
jgi:hypothetical protein